MSWNGKLLGLIIGAFIAGPIGLVIGFIIGHCYDIGLFDRWLSSIGIFRRGYRREYHADVQQIYFNATFSIMGYLAKSDGRVSEREIQAARNVMHQMDLSPELQREAIHLFNLGKQPDFDIQGTITELKKALWRHPMMLRTFLEIQIQFAMADGYLTSAKKTALENICQQFGLFGFSFDQFEQQQRAGQNYQRYYHQARRNPQQHLNDAYQVLGVSAKVNNAEVKKAYRRLMSQHHPDKLMAKGMPPEMIKLATQKTQQIKSAYETIKKARGM